MTTARFRVTHAGPQVTVQDAGRPGLMRFGVPASGPMDRSSFAIANAALGNPPGQAAIEVSRGGLGLECLDGAVTVAIAGGGFIVQAGVHKAGSWAAVTIRAGETLTLRPGPWGSWAYLAFAGNLQAGKWLGSRATHGPSGLGGGVLAVGQTLQIAGVSLRPEREGRIACPVWARPRHILRCVAGPQDRFFSAQTLAAFGSSTFALTDAGDRMGVRLRGPALNPEAALWVPSEPIVRGSVQVSGDGVATVLLADHQTTGGYPKIATVISDDIDSFVQCRPHDLVTFAMIAPGAAIAVARSHHRAVSGFLDRLQHLHRR